MKKIISFFLSFVMILTLFSSCGKGVTFSSREEFLSHLNGTWKMIDKYNFEFYFLIGNDGIKILSSLPSENTVKNISEEVMDELLHTEDYAKAKKCQICRKYRTNRSQIFREI